MMKDLSEEYSNPNIIYHYTSLQTLVNHILPEFQLKFSRRIDQDDYFERNYISPVFYLDQGQVDPQSLDDVESLIRQRFRSISQISFCKSGYSNEQIWEANKSYDGYGFLKHRMWDTYGMKNKGVCLALDQTIIEDNLMDLDIPNFWLSDVKYEKNEELKQIIKPSSTHKISDKSLTEASQDYLRYLLFIKNFDFRDENELRICIESSDEQVFLPIRAALKSIFFSTMGKVPISKEEKILFEAILKKSKLNGFDLYTIIPLSSKIEIYQAN